MAQSPGSPDSDVSISLPPSPLHRVKTPTPLPTWTWTPLTPPPPSCLPIPETRLETPCYVYFERYDEAVCISKEEALQYPVMTFQTPLAAKLDFLFHNRIESNEQAPDWMPLGYEKTFSEEETERVMKMNPYQLEDYCRKHARKVDKSLKWKFCEFLKVHMEWDSVTGYKRMPLRWLAA